MKSVKAGRGSRHDTQPVHGQVVAGGHRRPRDVCRACRDDARHPDGGVGRAVDREPVAMSVDRAVTASPK